MLVLAGILIAGYFIFKARKSTTSAIARKNSLFGTMLAFNVNNVSGDLTSALGQNGWSKFNSDQNQYQQFKTALETSYQGDVVLAKQTGFPVDREIGALFTWNVIEPQKGTFNWDLTDLATKYAGQAGEKFSAVIQPYASWDQQNTQPISGCQMLDASYYDFKAGPVNDTSEYENFLTKMVERYKNNVAVWEIGNEPDAACSGYQSDPGAYFNLLKTSYQTIKKADPSAIVVNGGASGFANTNNDEKNFWTTILKAGGEKYLDYFNLHHNIERSQDAKLDLATFEQDLQIYNDLMKANGAQKPIYLTEFGISLGLQSSAPTNQPAPSQNQPSTTSVRGKTQQTATPVPSSQGQGTNQDSQPNQSQTQMPSQAQTPAPTPTAQPTQTTPEPTPPSFQPMQVHLASYGQLAQANTQVALQSSRSSQTQTITQDKQAALYFEYSVIGFANGVNKIFIDLTGPDTNTVGSSAAFDTNGTARTFLSSLKTIDQRMAGFSKTEKITDGQYKFTVGGKSIYALWSGTLPTEISGQVSLIDYTGQSQTTSATNLKFSLEQPILVEL